MAVADRLAACGARFATAAPAATESADIATDAKVTYTSAGCLQPQLTTVATAMVKLFKEQSARALQEILNEPNRNGTKQ